MASHCASGTGAAGPCSQGAEGSSLLDCPICLVQLIPPPPGQRVAALTCGHMFHMQWSALQLYLPLSLSLSLSHHGLPPSAPSSDPHLSTLQLDGLGRTLAAELVMPEQRKVCCQHCSDRYLHPLTNLCLAVNYPTQPSSPLLFVWFATGILLAGDSFWG